VNGREFGRPEWLMFIQPPYAGRPLCASDYVYRETRPDDPGPSWRIEWPSRWRLFSRPARRLPTWSRLRTRPS
jgi:hypothetical protein